MVERTVPTPEEEAPAGQEPTRAEEVYARPPVDIYEDDQGLVVVADLPGVDANALDVRVDGGILTIQGRASASAPGDPIYREFEITGFNRQFQLPEEIDATKINAELKHGVLTLRLPRAERQQPRKIQVRTSA